MTAARDDAARTAPADSVDASVLVPTARTLDVWLRIMRRHPVPALLAVVAVVVWLALFATAPDWVADGLQSASWIVPAAVLLWARGRLLRASAPEARLMVPRRPALDSRPSGPTQPTWSWNSALGHACATVGALAAAATFGLGAGAVAGVIDGSAPALAMALILGICALVVAALAWTAVRENPAQCRHVVQHGAPTEVVVLGIEHEKKRWHLEPVNGGQIVVVEAFRGHSRLAAGDVVHLWQAPERKDRLDHRVAITGPFGTLWPSQRHEPAPKSHKKGQP